ncbi:MAG: hypothetical protein M2R45_05251 [Verrucomicrobia subdivision 3 bacterium]|nr:hypothetical protein [Limisphaerales bacterium]
MSATPQWFEDLLLEKLIVRFSGPLLDDLGQKKVTKSAVIEID